MSRHIDLSTNPRSGGHGRWCINDGEDGVFDAVVSLLTFSLSRISRSSSSFMSLQIVSVGTCSQPNSIESTRIPGIEAFSGTILHSSNLDGADLSDKKVVIIGSGASAVEAAELAVEKGADGIVVLARADKWIIPRNTLFDLLLALQPFGREMVSLPDLLLRSIILDIDNVVTCLML